MKNTGKLTVAFEDRSYSLTKARSDISPNQEFINRIFWLETERGQGIQISDEELFSLLDDYFVKNF